MLLLEEQFLLLSIVVVEWFTVLVSVVLALSDICSTSSWLSSRIVDVACWRPTHVAFNAHALAQFFGFIENVHPSNVLSGQCFVLFLVVEVGHLLHFFSNLRQKLKHQVCANVVSSSSCLNKQLSQSNVVLVVTSISANHGDNVGLCKLGHLDDVCTRTV